MSKPAVALLLQPHWRPKLISTRSMAELEQVADVVQPRGSVLSPEELPELLSGALACITGWETPPLDEATLNRAPTVRLVAHTAGTLRRLLPGDVNARGIRVTHAAAAMADAVAEHLIAQLLLLLQHLAADDRMMRWGGWTPPRWTLDRRLLGAQTIGVWGLGRVGRALLPLLRAFGSTVLVSDPTVAPDEARELGAELVSLHQLFDRSDAVCLLAPVLPGTRGAVTGELLALLRDGGALVNSGRAALVDQAALLRELRSGRIVAALDVFETEPLPTDHELRRLPNVILSPHVAGHTVESQLRQGDAMVQEVIRFVRGEPLLFEVDPSRAGELA